MQAGGKWLVMLTRTEVDRVRNEQAASTVGTRIRDKETGGGKMQKGILWALKGGIGKAVGNGSLPLPRPRLEVLIPSVFGSHAPF